MSPSAIRSSLEFQVGWSGWTRPHTIGGGGVVAGRKVVCTMRSRGGLPRLPNTLRLDSLGEVCLYHKNPETKIRILKALAILARSVFLVMVASIAWYSISYMED